MEISAMRAKLVGAPKRFQSELVTLADLDGETIEVRELTVGQREEINRRSMKVNHKTENVEFDSERSKIETVIASCYKPGTDERVFEDTDFETMRGLPVSGWFSVLSAACGRLGATPEGKGLAKN